MGGEIGVSAGIILSLAFILPDDLSGVLARSGTGDLYKDYAAMGVNPALNSVGTVSRGLFSRKKLSFLVSLATYFTGARSVSGCHRPVESTKLCGAATQHARRKSSSPT